MIHSDKHMYNEQITVAWFIQASLCEIQGLLKYFPAVFKDCTLMKNTDLHVKILFLKC